MCAGEGGVRWASEFSRKGAVAVWVGGRLCGEGYLFKKYQTVGFGRDV